MWSIKIILISTILISEDHTVQQKITYMIMSSEGFSEAFPKWYLVKCTEKSTEYLQKNEEAIEELKTFTSQ